MNIVIILIFMILFHIIDDYYLQGVLSKLKQKKFWEDDEVEKNEKYKYDYVFALFVHGLSWAIFVMLPLIVGKLGLQMPLKESLFVAVYILSNSIIHAVVDDLKANKRVLNLWQDQLIHFGQIIITWIIFGLVL